MIKFHMRKGKPFIHILSIFLMNFYPLQTQSDAAIYIGRGQRLVLKKKGNNSRRAILKILFQLDFLCRVFIFGKYKV